MFGFTLIGIGLGGISAYLILNSKNYIVKRTRADEVLNNIEKMLRETELNTNEYEKETEMIDYPEELETDIEEPEEAPGVIDIMNKFKEHIKDVES